MTCVCSLRGGWRKTCGCVPTRFWWFLMSCTLGTQSLDHTECVHAHCMEEGGEDVCALVPCIEEDQWHVQDPFVCVWRLNGARKMLVHGKGKLVFVDSRRNEKGSAWLFINVQSYSKWHHECVCKLWVCVQVAVQVVSVRSSCERAFKLWGRVRWCVRVQWCACARAMMPGRWCEGVCNVARVCAMLRGCLQFWMGARKDVTLFQHSTSTSVRASDIFENRHPSCGHQCLQGSAIFPRINVNLRQSAQWPVTF